jgi:hypothetical protein
MCQLTAREGNDVTGRISALKITEDNRIFDGLSAVVAMLKGKLREM